MRRTWLALAVVPGAGTDERRDRRGHRDGRDGQAVTAAEQLPDGDGPPGFWWGTDSFAVPVPGSAPYSMPFLGGAYGGYIGMTGNWAYWLGCKAGLPRLLRDQRRAGAHQLRHLPHGRRRRCRTGSWAGPASTRTTTGRTAEASAWGAQQAARALADIANGAIDYPVVSGWTSNCPASRPPPTTAGTTCTPRRAAESSRQRDVPAAVDRADFNGFATYIAAHSPYKAGVYSAPGVWTSIFGTGQPPPRSRTPTSGPTSRRPRTTPATPRSAGA